ncbi:MAG TPA: VOC family protein [Ignavibacteria bacterium]|nr:lactoylglutathione lyase [Bacteroidota bacterium]HRI84646.1 VOC family protein [Ignavibacteria bacterium]HRJ99268.1 VOC family protein [Ignavibacteria bacterium]
MASAINWFEIPVIDFDRAKKFYNEIFDIEMHEEMMGPHQMAFFPGEGVGGAIVKAEGHKPSLDGALVYLSGGTDLTNIMNRINAAGGKVLQPKTMVTEEIGYIAIFTDTEGNRVALHSPK